MLFAATCPPAPTLPLFLRIPNANPIEYKGGPIYFVLPPRHAELSRGCGFTRCPVEPLCHLCLERVSLPLLLAHLSLRQCLGVVVGDDQCPRLLSLSHPIIVHLVNVDVHDSLVTKLLHSLTNLNMELHPLVECLVSFPHESAPSIACSCNRRLTFSVLGPCVNQGVLVARTTWAHDSTRGCVREQRAYRTHDAGKSQRSFLTHHNRSWGQSVRDVRNKSVRLELGDEVRGHIACPFGLSRTDRPAPSTVRPLDNVVSHYHMSTRHSITITCTYVIGLLLIAWTYEIADNIYGCTRFLRLSKSIDDYSLEESSRPTEKRRKGGRHCLVDICCICSIYAPTGDAYTPE